MTWIEQRLSELAEEGYFDDLPGSGKPIADLDTLYSPTWWAARWVERDAARQATKHMHSKLKADVAAALELPSSEARQRLATIARGVEELNRLLDRPQQLPPIDVDGVIIRGGLG